MRDVQHSCGLFGIVNHPAATQLTYLGLYAQQHRGQESAGICYANEAHVERIAGLGTVNEAFRSADLESIIANTAIGHVRYSTTGGCSDANIQPLLVSTGQTQLAIAHNGNLVNAAAIRRDLEARGHVFMTTSDTEVVLHLLAQPRDDEHPSNSSIFRQLTGSFCFLIQYPDRIEAVRDPAGNRPLSLGKLDDAWVVASETCAFDIVGAEFIREVEPGEIVTLTSSGISSRRFETDQPQRRAHCIFEHVYFADPASYVFGENVHEFRKETGRQLAREAPVEGDLVIAVPNCARCAAIGYHEESGIPLGRGFTSNHYVGRSFIQPHQRIRDLTVRMKLNPIRASVEGKRLIVVEDSVVRGTTTRGKMEALRRAGAKEIHLRVASPPIKYPCYYGIDFPSHAELIANDHSIEEIRDALGVDSLRYLSLEGLLGACKMPSAHFCNACFSGKYPIPIDEDFQKDVFERNQLTFLQVNGNENGNGSPGPARSTASNPETQAPQRETR